MNHQNQTREALCVSDFVGGRIVSARTRKIIRKIVNHYPHDERWLDEPEFRNHFEISNSEKSVDGGCHKSNCDLVLVEETKKSIREALEQFKRVIEHIDRLHARRAFITEEVKEYLWSRIKTI